MKQDQFYQQHVEEWEQFEAVLGVVSRSGSNGRAISSDEVTAQADFASLPHRYRRITRQLAIARSRGYSFGLIARLETLALRGHQLLYARRRVMFGGVLRFFVSEFPSRFRAAWRAVVVAAFVFFGSMFLAAGLVAVHPEVIFTMLDPQSLRGIESMYDPGASALGRPRDESDDVVMFGYYIRNNTSIGFQTFSGGLVFGLGTIFFLVFNGLHIGAIGAHLVAHGFATPFWSFVSGHSSFELTAILISGTAGLQLGWRLLSPGRRTRRRALVEEARSSVRLIYGAGVLFFLAATVEAFWSSIVELVPVVKYSVGVAFWVVLWAYLLIAGRGADGN